MKTAALALFLCATALTARADNILANGDFADGTAHWKGDAKNPNASENNDMSSLDSNPANNGLVVHLSSGCTQISQIFSTRETSLTLTVAYKLSPDYKAFDWRPTGALDFSPPPPNSPPGTPSGNALTNTISQLIHLTLVGPIDAPSSSWLVLIVDPMQNKMCYSSLTPATGTPDAQTSTATVSQLMAHEEKTFYLVFPPGQGTVTLQKISLDPITPASTPEGTHPSPFSNP